MSRHHHNELHELEEKIRQLAYFLLGEEIMSQVQFSVVITVTPSTPPPPPLTEGAPSGTATFAQGVQSSVVLTSITGGVAPLVAPVVDPTSPSQLPPGITASLDASNNLILSGTPTVSGTATVLLNVNDSATPSVPAKA
jgi:hypothetical protein